LSARGSTTAPPAADPYATNELFVPEGDRKKEQSLSHQKRKMEKMEAKKTPPSSPLALLPDTPSGLSSAPRQMSSREMVREKVNRIKEKAAAQKAERASSSSSSSRKQKEEEVVVSCYVGMPSVPDDHASEDSVGDEDQDDEESGQKLSAEGKDEEEEAELDGRYAADDPVADRYYSSTVETPAAPYGSSPYESFNRGAGEGYRPFPPPPIIGACGLSALALFSFLRQSVYYADAVDEELARDEHEVSMWPLFFPSYIWVRRPFLLGQ
jgi:hypothetical protein